MLRTWPRRWRIMQPHTLPQPPCSTSPYPHGGLAWRSTEEGKAFERGKRRADLCVCAGVCVQPRAHRPQTHTPGGGAVGVRAVCEGGVSSGGGDGRAGIGATRSPPSEEARGGHQATQEAQHRPGRTAPRQRHCSAQQAATQQSSPPHSGELRSGGGEKGKVHGTPAHGACGGGSETRQRRLHGCGAACGREREGDGHPRVMVVGRGFMGAGKRERAQRGRERGRDAQRRAVATQKGVGSAETPRRDAARTTQPRETQRARPRGGPPLRFGRAQRTREGVPNEALCVAHGQHSERQGNRFPLPLTTIRREQCERWPSHPSSMP